MSPCVCGDRFSVRALASISARTSFFGMTGFGCGFANGFALGLTCFAPFGFDFDAQDKTDLDLTC